MSVGGVAVKTIVLLIVLVAAGAWGWASATEPVADDLGTGYANTTVTIPGGFWLASFGALFVGIFVAVNPRRAALLGVIYAALEGYVLGAISAMFDAQTEGIVGAAVVGTICVFLAALVLYVLRIIRPTRKMAFGVTAAIGGLGLLYFFVFILSIFNWTWLYSDSFRTIGIAVKCDAEIHLRRAHALLQLVEVERPTVEIDVAAVGRVGEDLRLRAERLEERSGET